MENRKKSQASVPDESSRPSRDSTQLNRTVGQIIKHLRRQSGMTLDLLANASGVSRAMLSSVERGEKSPTLSVLSAIAGGLGVTISRLMGEDTSPDRATLIRARQRLIFRDPSTGIERHLLSPSHLASGVELVEHVLPPGSDFPGSPVHEHNTDKYIVVKGGSLTLVIDSVLYVLEPEDAIYFSVQTDYRFMNRGDSVCRYYIFIVHRDRIGAPVKDETTLPHDDGTT